MFRKNSFIIAVLLCLLTGSTAFAQSPRVVILKSADIIPYNEAVEGFKKSCNCSVSEILHSDSADEAEIKKEVLDQRPELIFAVGFDALSHAIKIKELPVVYAMVPGSGLPDLPKGRVSGVSMNIPPEKYLSAMLGLFPSLKRIGVVYDQKNSGPFIKEADRIAKTRGVTLVPRQVSRPGEVINAIDSLRNRIDLLWMLPDVTVVNSETFKYMLGFSFENSLPVFTFAKKYVEIGAAAGLNAVPYDMGFQAGELANRIGNDKSSSEPVRVDQKNVGLIVNPKILRKLGTAVNEDVVKKAVNVR